MGARGSVWEGVLFTYDMRKAVRIGVRNEPTRPTELSSVLRCDVWCEGLQFRSVS